MNEYNFVHYFFFCFDLLPHCFSLLSAFLCSKSLQNNQMHCKIFYHYFNVLFVEIQLKKENLKSVFWVPEFGCPNWYTGLLTTWIHHWNELGDFIRSIVFPNKSLRYIHHHHICFNICFFMLAWTGRFLWKTFKHFCLWLCPCWLSFISDHFCLPHSMFSLVVLWGKNHST